jgi:hypothetical protein
MASWSLSADERPPLTRGAGIQGSAKPVLGYPIPHVYESYRVMDVPGHGPCGVSNLLIASYYSAVLEATSWGYSGA